MIRLREIEMPEVRNTNKSSKTIFSDSNELSITNCERRIHAIKDGNFHGYHKKRVEKINQLMFGLNFLCQV